MTRTQQPSILSFFQKQSPPKYAAPPSQQAAQPQQLPSETVGPPPPPQAPPLPQQPLSAKPAVPIISALPTAFLSPHPSASFVTITKAHIPALRRINAVLLPVNYQDSFYEAILNPAVSGLFSRVIVWQDSPEDTPKVIGGLVCRLEPSPFDASSGRYSPELARKAHTSVSPPRVGESHVLYIQSLGLLAPYRQRGLAAAAVQGALDAAAQLTREKAPGGPRIDWLYAHVWTQNEDGLEWYMNRGFEKDGQLEDYYMKLQPGSAWVVKKRVVHTEGVDGKENAGWANGVNSQPAPAVPASVTAAVVNLPGFAATPTPTRAATPSTTNGPPKSTTGRPPLPESSLSFQNKRPDMEWNDLPEDMVGSAKNTSRNNLLAPPTGGSGSSSRSSSVQRKKKDRAYPTAAFGN